MGGPGLRAHVCGGLDAMGEDGRRGCCSGAGVLPTGRGGVGSGVGWERMAQLI